MIKLEQLTKLYLNNKNTNPNYNVFDNIETLDFYDVDKNIYEMNCKLVKVNGEYRIYIIIAINKENSKLDIIFSGLLENRRDNIKDIYNSIKNDIKELSVEQFINKYYDKLIEKNTL